MRILELRYVLGAVLLLMAPRTGLASVMWDGGGGDFSWQNPANWSGDVLPGPDDDVIIDVASNVTITSSANVTILSLQCSNNLALSDGIFKVTAGASTVQGAFASSGNPTLSASGSATVWTVAGDVSVDGLSLDASGGAIISLPMLSSYSKGTGCAAVTWKANGGGSTLDLPALATLTGAACASFNVQATSGGEISMTTLTDVAEGTAVFLADGTNSVVDLSGLHGSTATDRTVSFEARNGGAILMPQMAGGPKVNVAIKSGGTLPVSQLAELNGFTVSGTNLSFPSLTNLTEGHITVDGGAVVTVPQLVRYSDSPGCAAPTWLVSGFNSVLDLSSLIELTGPTCATLNLQATAGGTLILSNLPAITEGTINLLADGTNSVIDLGGLQQSLATSRSVNFEARNGGTMWMPQLPGGPTVTVSLRSDGVLPVAQLEQLSGFTVDAMTVDFPALTNLVNGNVTVAGGGSVTAPNFTGHVPAAGCFSTTWLVTGTDSILDLSSLTMLSGPTCGNMHVQAKAGGTFILSNFPAITEGTLTFLAEGASSVVDLSALQESLATVRSVNFEARDSGTILMPQFPGGPTVAVTLRSDGVLPVAQFGELRGLTVDGMTVDFPGLTNLTTGNVTASGGAVVTIPNVRGHAETNGCLAYSWEANGAGSVLNFPGLTNLIGVRCGQFNIRAISGGACLFENLATVGDGTLDCLADGTDSLIDLTSLSEVQATGWTVSFEARNAGTIAIPFMEGGPTVTVAIKSDGQIDAMQLRLLKGLTVSGTSLALPGITNLFAGDLTVDEGAVLSLPNLFAHDQGSGCSANIWRVSGIGSVLDLSSITNLTGAGCGSLTLEAASGGSMILSNLPVIADGTLRFGSDGAGSLVDLASLQECLATLRDVTFEVKNQGAIDSPFFVGGPTVNLVVHSNGVIPVAQFTQLSGVIANAATLDFPALTNFDGGSFVVTNGAVVTASNLLAYAQSPSCVAETWLVKGASSVLNLPALAQLTGDGCGELDAQALSGGQLLLGSVTNIIDGDVDVLSDGAGSVVDLHSLGNFLNASSLSSLVATNGGSILLNEQPFLLSGVLVDFAAGTPGFPATMLAGTNLVLHGIPWHSYWVEIRDTTAATIAWHFFQRVPLTNEFQIIAPRAEANREFRVWEFVADPFGLELSVLPDAHIGLVLYGPIGNTFDVLSATNLMPTIDWQTIHTVPLTNTFRILPPELMIAPEKFFSVDPL